MELLNARADQFASPIRILPKIDFGLSSAKAKNVVVLMADTGGGHRASAQAIEAALGMEKVGDLKITLVDLWSEHAYFPHNKMVKGYSFLGKHPRLWKLLYYTTASLPGRKFEKFWTAFKDQRRFEEALDELDPDLVVSVHPLTQYLPLRALNHLAKKRGGNRPPFVTVVTDLGSAHPFWFHKDADLTFVPSDELYRKAIIWGVPEHKLRQHGLPVRRDFWQPAKLEDSSGSKRRALRGRLGLRPNALVVLVVSGGDGFGPVKKIVRQLDKTLRAASNVKDVHIVVICGRNKRLLDDLHRFQEDKDSYIKAYGFVSNMAEYMKAADCIVTKAGPGTLAEAAIQGLPVMLCSHLPGQEAGNVRVVIDQGFGEYSTRPKVIARTVLRWLSDPKLLKRMRQKALEAARPFATRLIAKDLAAVLLETDDR